MYKILVVDYANLLYRSYWSAKGSSAGPGLAIFRFAQSLYVSMRQSKCNNLVLAGESFTILNRTKLDRTYKSGRKTPDRDFHIFSNCLKGMLKIMGLNIIHYPGYEGDDIIAAICKLSKDDKIYIMSADKDLRQLLKTDKVVILQTDINRSEYTEEDFWNEHGFSPNQYHIYKALVGDRSDSIPGVIGVGPVLASEIMHMDNFEEGLNKLSPEQYYQFSHALNLIKLDPDIPFKTFKNYISVKYCTAKQFRIAKKLFIKCYGEILAEGVINEFKKIFDIESIRSKVISVEFDSMLVEDKRPKIGSMRKEVLDLILFEREKGAKIILETERTGKELNFVIEFCKGQGLVFDEVADHMIDNAQRFELIAV